ncbi:uncharacterized protein LOC136064960 [Quercus suber]|uniref:uncharacterized protein LOC136064960 n=1 Tax=Quercus suber TaxID=58331 RepID=UPI0032DFE6C7
MSEEETVPVAKRTRSSSQPSTELNIELFRTPQHQDAYFNIFDRRTLIVEREVRFDTLDTTFVPRIFETKDWAALFGNFVDLMIELVKECFANTVDLESELHCLVRGTKFIINLDTIAELLKITRPVDADLTPYDDCTPVIQDILQILGPDHDISSTGTLISTTKFSPELTTLKLIMFSNLYPLTNTVYINLGRAQFLCDLITGTTIDICAHIYHIIRKTTTRTVAQGCLPFCSLIMNFVLREGVTPPSIGNMIARPRPISMFTLQASKSHSSKAPKSAHLFSPTSSTSEQPGTTQPQSAPQPDKLQMLFDNIHKRLTEMEKTLRDGQKEQSERLVVMQDQIDVLVAQVDGIFTKLKQ